MGRNVNLAIGERVFHSLSSVFLLNFQWLLFAESYRNYKIFLPRWHRIHSDAINTSQTQWVSKSIFTSRHSDKRKHIKTKQITGSIYLPEADVFTLYFRFLKPRPLTACGECLCFGGSIANFKEFTRSSKTFSVLISSYRFQSTGQKEEKNSILNGVSNL